MTGPHACELVSAVIALVIVSFANKISRYLICSLCDFKPDPFVDREVIQTFGSEITPPQSYPSPDFNTEDLGTTLSASLSLLNHERIVRRNSAPSLLMSTVGAVEAAHHVSYACPSQSRHRRAAPRRRTSLDATESDSDLQSESASTSSVLHTALNPNEDNTLFDFANDDVFEEEYDYIPVTLPDHVHGVQKGKESKRRKAHSDVVFDVRTDDLIVRPGDEVEWGLDIGIAQKIPLAFKHKLKDSAHARLKGGLASAATASSKKINAYEFLYDSGCTETQIPSHMRGMLDNVRKISPIRLDTAGGDSPVCTEAGTLKFTVRGVSQIFEIDVLLNPSSSLLLLSLDEFEGLNPGRIWSRLWNNDVSVMGTSVPIIRHGKAPYLSLNVLSGTVFQGRIQSSSSRVMHRKGAAAVSGSESYDFVHRLCAHAGIDTCRRTAAKADGLPSLYNVPAPKRPCPECTMGKMKAASVGFNDLSTGLQPTGPGQVFCGDTFGPIAIPGVAGERYFIVLVCQFSRWGVARAFVSLEEVPYLIEEMVTEIRSTLGTSAEKMTITVHTDNASVFKSSAHVKNMATTNVHLHYADPYEPRTNPYAERYGGILIPTIRALLLEGSYPPKFWSLLLRVACWIQNRLVRPMGSAPLELFVGQKSDFSRAHPTGTMCYWHVPKTNRDDSKLGNAAAVGVYIGPGEAFGSRGHMVYTTNDKIKSVSHVLVDNSTKPFQLGLLRELLKKSERVTSTYDQAQVNPDAYILANGDSAFNYVGQWVRKTFVVNSKKEVWRGRVTRLIPPEGDEDDEPLYFQVVYTDGEVEDYTFAELRPLLELQGKQPSSAAASVPAEIELGEAWDVFDESDLLNPNNDEVTVPYVLEDYQQLLLQASRNVAASATVAEGLPYGETYSWMKVFKMSPLEREKHVKAMQAEVDKLTSAGHARWEHLPPGEVAIPSVGVFRVKSHDLHAGGHTLKARFCANGQAVNEPPGGWDSTANVASCSQILTVIALAVQLNLRLAQIDVKSAFTQVKLRDDQRIWVKSLPGLNSPGSKDKVLRLYHHLYGHPLANAAFQDRWVELMQEFGFIVVDAAKTVFSYQNNGQKLLVATVVDDSVVAYSDQNIYDKFTSFLRARLPITESPLDTVCGMRVVKHDDGSISVDQREYIEKKAKAFRCDSGGRRFMSPMDIKFSLGTRPVVPDKKLVSYARELMGSLIYATITRPECKYACSKLASVVTNPTQEDIVAMERVMKYLYSSRNTALTYHPGSWKGPDGTVHAPLEFTAFVDAGFAQEEGRRSQTGFAIMLAGAAIVAKSGKQSQVTDSTGYAETIALHEAANWVLMVRNQMKRMFSNWNISDPSLTFEHPLKMFQIVDADQQEIQSGMNPTKMYEDNSAAVTFAKKGPGPRSLHWDVKLQYVHELQERSKEILVQPIDTKLQIADVLTKALAIDQHLQLSAFLLGGPVCFD